MALTPTDEQMQAIGLFNLGGSLAIQAGAGTGKTACLQMLAESAPHRTGQYTAFNKLIVTDAGSRMPSSVVCSTFHSLAMRAVGRRFRHRLGSGRMKSMDVARKLRIDPLTVSYGAQRKYLAPGYLAGLTMRTVANFCQSGDREPAEHHVPYVDGIDAPTADGARGWSNNRDVRAHVLPAARRAWADLSDPDGTLTYTHAAYLKYWELNRPVIAADFLMVDEFQDVPGVMLSIIEQQAGIQLVGVGDSAQCQPPGTKVLTTLGERPIEKLIPGDLVVTYRMAGASFRMSGRRINAIAEKDFAGELVTVEAEGFRSRYTPDHWCVARAKSLAGRTAVYVMRKDDQYRIGAATWARTGGGGPIARAHQEGADAVWILETYPTKREALIVEAVTAANYGLPMITFKPVNAGWVMDDETLAAVWAGIGDNRKRAEAALEAFGREIDFPLWDGVAYTALARRPMRMRACNLLDGMEVRTFEDGGTKDRTKGRWLAASIGREYYEGVVWSLDVDHEHSYIADGLATFNCINGWMGARDALGKMGAEHEAVLSQSFRFGPAVADVANGLLERIGSPMRLTGAAPWASVVAEVAEPTAVLTRTNAEAVRTVLEAQRDGRTVHLTGGADEVRSFARGATQLMADGWTSHHELACFSSWGEVQDYADVDEMGRELQLLVKLVDEFGADVVVDCLSRSVPQDRADLVVSTAHRAKGMGWDSVKLADDFFSPRDGEADVNRDELMLMYVACTRAKRELDVTLVPQALAAPQRKPIPLPAVTPVPVAAGPVGYQGEVVTRGPIEVGR